MYRVSLLALILSLLPTITIARPLDKEARVFIEPISSQILAETKQDRALPGEPDTLYLFAASGPGAWGSPGTDDWGYTFDDAPFPAEAGWQGVDLTATSQEWHLADTDICAGTGTDMSWALPFAPEDPINDYALWCGRENICGSYTWTGYGNDWDCWVAVALDDFATALFDFDYIADFEGDTWDYFQVMLMVDDELVELLINDETGEQTPQHYGVVANASDYPGQEIGGLILRFHSDGAWSDEDGLFESNVGAVWLDNLVLNLDGDVVMTDFEDGLVPDWIGFALPEGAGNYAALYHMLFQEDICIHNSSYFWAFFDPFLLETGSPLPLVPYGPPYVNNIIQSPLIEWMHHDADPNGEPFNLDMSAGDRAWLHYWIYGDMPNNALVYFYWDVAAYVDGCLMPWVDSSTIYFIAGNEWMNAGHDITDWLDYSAQGQEVDGLRARLGIVDMCAFWCDLYGDGQDHSGTPFLDNIRLRVIREEKATWVLNEYDRFQDNFGRDWLDGVRLDVAVDVAPPAPSSIVPGDSLALYLNMDALGGIAESLEPMSGDIRPELYLWWRVATGPNEGIVGPDFADQDASDGIFSPYAGDADFAGDIWGLLRADYARVDDSIVANMYAFDFHDAAFEPGDVIHYFFEGEAQDGTLSQWPIWAKSADPDLRECFIVRCLPTEGSTMLLVEDDPAVHYYYWDSCRRNGYFNYDIYSVHAPGTGLNNGLAGRAIGENLSQYEVIVWDSGTLGYDTLCDGTGFDKTDDITLLTEYLEGQYADTHDVHLWVLGNHVASDIQGSPFLSQVLGVAGVAGDVLNVTGQLRPPVYAVHPDLEYLGGMPWFWIVSDCPYRGFDAPFMAEGPHITLTHDMAPWEDDSFPAMGVLNEDPDGNGSILNEQGYVSSALFNAFSYSTLRDADYGLPAEQDYRKLMLAHVLSHLFNHEPDAMPDDVAEGVVPAVTDLAGCYPNPFNPTTAIRLSMAQAGPAKLAVYDISGRLVRTLHDGPLAAGPQELIWDGRGDSGAPSASGVYFVRFEAGEHREANRLVLLK